MSRLVTWLNDHLAVAMGAAELARRTHRAIGEKPWAEGLEDLASALDDDRECIKNVLEAMGSGPSRVKETVGWLAEKVTRIRMNEMNPLTPSPLNRLEELETLLLAVASIGMMWRTLEHVRGELGDFDPSARADVIEEWLGRLRAAMEGAAKEALPIAEPA